MLNAIKSILLGALVIVATIAVALFVLWAALAWARADFPLPFWLLPVGVLVFLFFAWSLGESLRGANTRELAIKIESQTGESSPGTNG